MKKSAKSLRSPLGRVRGLGTAGHGTEHWWLQRVTALALIPLSLYFVFSFIHAVMLGYADSLNMFRNVFSATFVIFFLGAGFHHAASGVQVVIEDYIHCEGLKLFSIMLVKFLCAFFAILGILAIVKILFGV